MKYFSSVLMFLLISGCGDNSAQVGYSLPIGNLNEENFETNYCRIHYIDGFANVYDMFTDPSCEPHICGDSPHGNCSQYSNICQWRIGQECTFSSQNNFNSLYIELEEQREMLTTICANIYSCSVEEDGGPVQTAFVDCSFFFDQIPRLTEVVSSWTLTQCYEDTLVAWNFINYRKYEIPGLCEGFYIPDEEKDQAIASVLEIYFPNISTTSFLSRYCSF
jgi:hypothetical protein